MTIKDALFLALVKKSGLIRDLALATVVNLLQS